MSEFTSQGRPNVKTQCAVWVMGNVGSGALGASTIIGTKSQDVHQFFTFCICL